MNCQPRPSIEEQGGDLLLRVRVQPRASRNAIRLEPDGRVRVAVTAPAAEGAANQAVTDFVAKALGMPKRAVILVSGEKARNKTLRLMGVARAEIRAKLSGGLGGG